MLQSIAILGFVLAEALAIFGLVLAFVFKAALTHRVPPFRAPKRENARAAHATTVIRRLVSHEVRPRRRRVCRSCPI